MKAISLWQPWASLMAHGMKTIETRDWYTFYRGPLIIHAAKRKMDALYPEALADFVNAGIDWTDLPFGKLLCQLNLYDVETIWHPYNAGREAPHGNFRLGRSAWKTKDLKIFKNPIPFRGHQGFFNVPDELLEGN